ncbi:MAG: hypothetical protein WC457_03625 [Patescibacteria group bacterium]
MKTIILFAVGAVSMFVVPPILYHFVNKREQVRAGGDQCNSSGSSGFQMTAPNFAMMIAFLIGAVITFFVKGLLNIS